MKIRAQDLAAGDVLEIHDWNLHVLDVDRDGAVAVRTAEFDFLIHFVTDEVVTVRESLEAA
jgi:hypothetical protein